MHFDRVGWTKKALGLIALAPNVLAGVMLLGVETASATVIQQIESFTTDSTLHFDPFDPSQGNLTGITAKLISGVTVSVALTVDPPSQSGPGSPPIGLTTATFMVLLPDGTNFTTTQTDQCTSAGSGCSDTSSASFNGGPSDVPSANLFQYEGTIPNSVSVNLSVSNGASSVLCPSGSTCTASGSFTWSGSVELDYTYTPTAVTAVPEPASLTLLGSALLGFGVIRRRRKRGMQASELVH